MLSFCSYTVPSEYMISENDGYIEVNSCAYTISMDIR